MAFPVLIADGRRQLRLDEDDTSQDQLIEGFIKDAAAWVEQYTGHILVARDVAETFCGFGAVTLRAWPVAPNAVPSIAYIDPAGNPASLLPALRVDVGRRRARILPAVGSFFPFWRADQSFTVTIRAGYESPDAVPGNLRRAMLLLIAAYDDDREGGDTFAKAVASARTLCSTFRPRSV